MEEIGWKYGHLHPEVKEMALRQIQLGADLERWGEESKAYKKRKQVLEDLANKF